MASTIQPSSHSGNELDDGVLACCTTQGSEMCKDDRTPSPPRQGEMIAYEEIYVPDVN